MDEITIAGIITIILMTSTVIGGIFHIQKIYEHNRNSCLKIDYDVDRAACITKADEEYKRSKMWYPVIILTYLIFSLKVVENVIKWKL